ncbi:Tetratricopeptide repeat [Balamuthia mandrillaris]
MTEKGLAVLFSLLQEKNNKSRTNALDLSVQAECLKVLEVMVTAVPRARRALNNPTAIKDVLRTLSTEDVRLKASVLRLLSLFCILEPENGTEIVLDAFSWYKQEKKERKRFETVIQSLDKEEDLEFLLQALSFLNAVVNSPPDVDTRMMLRQELEEELGFAEVRNKLLLTWKDQSEQMMSLLKVYEEETKQDENELKRTASFRIAGVSAENADAMFHVIKRSAQDGPNHDAFLSVLQSLTKTATTHLGSAEVWNGLASLLKDYYLTIAASSNANDKNHKLVLISSSELEDMKQVHRSKVVLLNKRIQELQAVLQKVLLESETALSEETSARVFARAYSCSSLMEDTETEDAKEEIDEGDDKEIGGKAKAKKNEKKAKKKVDRQQKRKEIAEKKEKKKEKKKKRKGTLDEKEAAHEAANQQPTPREEREECEHGIACTIADPEHFIRFAHTRRVQTATTKTEEEEPTDAEDESKATNTRCDKTEDEEAEPATNDLSYPSDDGSSLSSSSQHNVRTSRARSVTTGPGGGLPFRPKVLIYPSHKQLKPLSWVKLPGSAASLSSFWRGIDDSSALRELNTKALEELFSKEVIASDEKEGEQQEVEKKEGPEIKEKEEGPITLLEPLLANRGAIFLSKLGKSNEELLNALLQLDEDILTGDVVTGLMDLVPSSEDLDRIEAFPEKDRSRLGALEQYFWAIRNVPRLEQRLVALKFKFEFAELYSNVQPDVETVRTAIREVEQSHKLKGIFGVILAIGNYLNAGSYRGQASGFKLNALSKLADLKSSDGQITLTHFLANAVATKHENLLDFSQELSHVEPASRVVLCSLREGVKKLVEGIHHIEQELKLIPNNTDNNEQEENKNEECTPEEKNSNNQQTENKDRFYSVMSEFVNNNRTSVEEIETGLIALEEEFAALAEALAEPQQKTTPTKLFRVLSSFMANFDRAHYENIQRQKREESEQQKRESNSTASTFSRWLGLGNSSHHHEAGHNNNEVGTSPPEEIMNQLASGALFRNRRTELHQQRRQSLAILSVSALSSSAPASPEPRTKAQNKASVQKSPRGGASESGGAGLNGGGADGSIQQLRKRTGSIMAQVNAANMAYIEARMKEAAKRTDESCCNNANLEMMARRGRSSTLNVASHSPYRGPALNLRGKLNPPQEPLPPVPVPSQAEGSTSSNVETGPPAVEVGVSEP